MATDRIVRLDINVPESLSDELERVARTENRTPDAFVQEAIERLLLLKRHRALQDFGNDLAEKKGFAEADVQRFIKETRTETTKRER